jgi:WD40 repeat protein
MGACAGRVKGRELLASASYDATVWIWDPRTSHARHVIPVHYEALGLAAVSDGCLVVGLSTGLLALNVTQVNKNRKHS